MPGTANSGGRNRKSAQTHVLLGTFQKCRHGDGEAPEPPVGKPEPPRPLKGEAKSEWARMVARLELSQTLSKVDDAALYQYVQLHAETESITADNTRVRSLSASLKKAIKNLDGMELVEAIDKIVSLQHIISNQVRQLRQGHMALRQYLVEFGMTPTARSRVKANGGQKPASKIDAFRASKTGA